MNITSKDVQDIIKSLKVNKASGMDVVSHRILKKAIDSISKPLCKIFKVRGPFVQTLCIEKDSYMDAI